ncbi:hypothetical protein CHLNCDRAFT_137374 [Chlorella variabilis]|uniref:Uncharacterized protein n=1 Tax=Chlorella variabilis TaxID=554065 RepID=E1ZMA5_CHLVA|nr:hypothetical protein CHLNCDRAFT_137374 [Chlorella variabilis]EFN53074.1 hypothetical protein CHLNCDRAFT_137374 [Chlorella variabilis]|eukprot:XP_005845176.1 hypothetical protein CHLNCDRAFT_137374 [Chlorella variabilis]
MQQEVSELEALVAAACARGVDAARCRDVVEDAVRRARRRGSMLPHLDSSLLLSTLEQAKSEIASLSDVTATNAEVMEQELLHHEERAEEQAAAGSEDVAAASVQSLPDTRTAKAAASSSSGQQGSVVGLGEEDASAHSGGLAPPTPSQPPGGALSAADAVAPMRDFASDVAAEAAAEADEDRFFRHTLSMKASKSGDFRVAQSYDFETAVSPRAAYHVRDEPFRFSSSSDKGGSSVWQPTAAEEEEGQEDLLVYSRSTPGGEEAEPGQEEEEEEAVARPAAYAPAGPWAAAAPRHGSYGSSRCCSSIPPGLNPMAAIEGGVEHDDEREAIDPQSPTGVGQLDLRSYNEAPFSLHSVTPPRHVMAELAAEVQGQLRL